MRVDLRLPKLKLILTLVFTLGATGQVFATQQHIEVRYSPDTALLDIQIYGLKQAQIEALNLPEWLTIQANPAVDSTVVQGVVPSLSEGYAQFGAGESGTYLFDLFSWLETLSEYQPEYLEIAADAGQVGLASGALTDELSGDDSYRARFRLYPPWHEVDLFFGPYTVRETSLTHSNRAIKLRTYFKDDEQIHSDAYLEATRAYLTRYSDLIGPYPHTSFAVVSAPIPVGFALDGLTYISEQILDHSYMLGRSLAHEVLHSWWGSGVRIDYTRGNWAEGLTSYLADYALAEEQSDERARVMRGRWLAGLTQLDANEKFPLREFVSAGHQRNQSIGYGKSALLFHQLKTELGSEVFNAALKTLWRDYQNRSIGWAEIEQVFIERSEQDLTPLFDQWLNRTGLPELSITDLSTEQSQDGYRLNFTLEQSEPHYRLRVPIRIDTSTKAHWLEIEIDQGAVQQSLDLRERPESIAIDPDFELLRNLSDCEISGLPKRHFAHTAQTSAAETKKHGDCRASIKIE